MPHSIVSAIRETGLLRSEDCLRCDVCCRFPTPTSPLAPFFGNAEIEQAVGSGVPAAAFPPGTYGPGHAVELAPWRGTFRCPAFEESKNSCSIYAGRPLDCRLYPFMLMFDRSGQKVLLGLDSHCPAVSARRDDPRFSACVGRLRNLLDRGLRRHVLDCRGIVTAWKEHIQPLVQLPKLSRELCRSDLGLARLVPTVYGTLHPFFAEHRGSLFHHALGPIAVWRDVFDLRWKIAGERLLIFAEGDGDCFLMVPPLGRGPVAGPAEEALAVMRRLNPAAASPRMQEVAERTARTLVRAGWHARERDVEYVYRRTELAELRGNRYAKKRQSCNRFEREHDRHWRPFESEDLPAAAELCRKWLAHRHKTHPDDFFMAQAEASYRCIVRGLCDAETMGLDARVLEADGRMVGVTVGGPLHDEETYQVLFEIADLTVKGTAQFMFRRFCREMAGVELVNAGGTSGLPGLARVKESYRPCRRLRTFTVVPPQ